MDRELNVDDLLSSDASGLCLHCVGHSQQLCFCQFLVGEQSTTVTPQFISSNTSLPPQVSEPENQTKHKTIKTKRKGIKRGGKKPKSEKVSSRKLKKDNISHKRISTFVKNIAQSLLRRKLTTSQKTYFYREDYVIRIFTILERQGLLKQGYESYVDQMENLIKKIETSESDQPEYCDQLIKQIKSFEVAFAYFLKDRHELSMRIIYDYEKMRQKAKFISAVNEIEKMRQQQGLPFYRE